MVVSTAITSCTVTLICLFEQDGKVGYRVTQWWMAFNLWAIGCAREGQRAWRTSIARGRTSSCRTIAPPPTSSRSASRCGIFSCASWPRKSCSRSPIFGWGLRALGNIIIDRSNHVQAMRSYAVAGQRIRRGISVMVFPEGTRGEGDELLPFKKGGFVLAIETGNADRADHRGEHRGGTAEEELEDRKRRGGGPHRQADRDGRACRSRRRTVSSQASGKRWTRSSATIRPSPRGPRARRRERVRRSAVARFGSSLSAGSARSVSISWWSRHTRRAPIRSRRRWRSIAA